jgi:hypothetical protein
MPKTKKKVVQYGLDENGHLGVYAISLVEFPAIETDFIALAKQEQIKLSVVDGERRMLYGPALIPDKEILRIDKNGEEYFALFPKEIIMSVAHGFLKKNQHHNATLEHAVEIDGCTVVESWLKEGEQDKAAHLGFDLPDGTWMIGLKVDRDDVWEEVKAGKVKGFSIEGLFTNIGEQFSRVADEDLLLKEIEEAFNQLNQQ